MRAQPDAPSILVKRYAQSRLHDKTDRRCVSVEQLRAWAARGVSFSVVDANDGQDVARLVLA